MEYFYDIEDDWYLIEASFLKQYGIRLRMVNDMPYSEFCSYLSGIMPDTPLGQIVQIRAEENEEVLKNFTQDQRRIRSEWRNRRAKDVSQEDMTKVLESFEKMFRDMSKGGA